MGGGVANAPHPIFIHVPYLPLIFYETFPRAIFCYYYFSIIYCFYIIISIFFFKADSYIYMESIYEFLPKDALFTHFIYHGLLEYTTGKLSFHAKLLRAEVV